MRASMPAAKTKSAGSPLKAVGAWKKSKKLKLLDRAGPRKELFALPLQDEAAGCASRFLDEARGFVAIGQQSKLEVVWLATGERPGYVDAASCHFLRGNEVTFRAPIEEDSWEHVVAHGEKVTARVQTRPSPRAKSRVGPVLRCFG